MKKKKDSVDEILDELSPYTAYLLNLIEEKIKEATFFSYKYHSEEYYEEVCRLKKVLNLLRFLLK